MDTKIFLQGFNSKKSSNTSNGVNVELKGRRKLLPLNDVAEVISQYDLYTEERENCNIIRLTCQVNPICSNVLFNKITEIVKGEGSDKITFINYGVSNDDQPFNNVVYKPSSMIFWSSSTMSYITVDNSTTTTDSTENLHPTNAIRDTQLSKYDSNDECFVYHCGIDFFNNHLLRSKTFKTVCKMPNNYSTTYTAFNTIADMMRDVKGNNVTEKLYYPTSAMVQGNAKLVTMHLYGYDDIDTFDDCVSNKLIKKYNGWLGFNNKSKIKSYEDFVESKSLNIDRPIMYENGGNFIDMYPTRDLYSFVPKFNKHRDRIEKNWNYCITYPSSSFTPSDNSKPFSDVIECNDGINSLKAMYFDENTRADNGTSQLVIYGISKHGLRKGDYVNIYKTYVTDLYWVESSGKIVSEKFETRQEANDAKLILEYDYPSNTYSISSETKVTVNKKVIDNAEVSEIVDPYIFVVFNSDAQISKYWVYLSESEKSGSTPLTIKRNTEDGGNLQVQISQDRKYFYNTGNTDIRYYIINGSYVNFDDKTLNISYKKVVNDIECDYYVRIFSRFPNFKFASADTSNEYEIYRKHNGHTMLDIYQDRKYEFESHVSRLAFAKNIYSDNIGEIVFTDDIDISNIKDNLGRPLTSLYLTIIKNNMGYKEWYGGYSGWKVDDISDSSIEYSHCFGKITCGLETSEESIENVGINSINRINNIEGNAGYIIGGEINPTSDTIDTNEIWYNTDKHFYGDLCYYDNYNALEIPIQQVMHRFNTAQRESSQMESGRYFSAYTYDEIMYDDYDASNKFEIKTISVPNMNVLKEGYYYEPHYEIPIKTFDKLQTATPDFLTIRRIIRNDGTYQITTLQQHFLSVGDKSMIYDKVDNIYFDCVTVNGVGDNYKVFTCKVYNEGSETLAELSVEDLSRYRLFKMDNLDIPSYAKVLKDGTCRVIWRNILNNGFNKSDNSVEEYPFTNGAFYINKKIDIYVRRQDPYNIWGLYDECDEKGNEMDISTENNYVKDGDIVC